MGTCGHPIPGPGVHIRQTTCVHVTTTNCQAIVYSKITKDSSELSSLRPNTHYMVT